MSIMGCMGKTWNMINNDDVLWNCMEYKSDIIYIYIHTRDDLWVCLKREDRPK